MEHDSADGGTFTFDGRASFVRVDTSTFESPLDDFSIVFEFMTTQAAGHAQQGGLQDDAGEGGVTSDAGVSIGGEQLMFGIGADGKWHELLATFERSSGLFHLRLDGKWLAAKKGSAASFSAPEFVDIGRIETNGEGGFFAGKMRNVCIYDSVLSIPATRSLEICHEQLRECAKLLQALPADARVDDSDAMQIMTQEVEDVRKWARQYSKPRDTSDPRPLPRQGCIESLEALALTLIAGTRGMLEKGRRSETRQAERSRRKLKLVAKTRAVIVHERSSETPSLTRLFQSVRLVLGSRLSDDIAQMSRLLESAYTKTDKSPPAVIARRLAECGSVIARLKSRQMPAAMRSRLEHLECLLSSLEVTPDRRFLKEIIGYAAACAELLKQPRDYLGVYLHVSTVFFRTFAHLSHSARFAPSWQAVCSGMEIR